MKCLRSQDGMALLLVLVVITLLSALLTEFSFSTLVDLRATETFRDRAKAFYLARGGVEAARMILQDDRNSFDHPSELWGEDLPNVPAGDGEVGLKITDISGRLNLNSLADRRGNRRPSFHRFVVLCEEVLQTDTLEAQQMAEAIVNWLNADLSKVTPDDSYYAAQNPPYRRKGGALDTLDELVLLRDFDNDKLQQLKPFVRVVGAEEININTASAEILYAWQHSALAGTREIVFDPVDIEALIEYRQQAPFRQLSDLALAEGIGNRWASAWEQGSVTVKGSVFQVESRGRVNQGSRLAEAVILKQGNTLQSLRVE